MKEQIWQRRKPAPWKATLGDSGAQDTANGAPSGLGQETLKTPEPMQWGTQHSSGVVPPSLGAQRWTGGWGEATKMILFTCLGGQVEGTRRPPQEMA